MGGSIFVFRSEHALSRTGIRTGGLSAGVPVSTLLAGGRRQVVPVLSGSAKSGQKENENCASSGVLAKDNSF